VTPDDDPEKSKRAVISNVVQNKECCVDGIQEILSYYTQLNAENANNN
jgi:hypothetical protein